MMPVSFQQINGETMEPRLAVTAGPLKGRVFTLTEEEAYIGRSGDSAVRIYDPTDPVNLAVSRKHCLIRRTGGEFFIHDLKSRNKTLVNGDPITERRLEHGDHIQ